MMSTFIKGQLCWFQRNYGDGEILAIRNIGRKWGLLTNGERFDLETLEVDGGDYSSPGTIYHSEADYKAEVELQSEWLTFQTAVQNESAATYKFTRERIQQAKELLGL